ncbi:MULTISPECIES: hypothetical protein [unclassified Serratia (in: enterobacteria)]|uniref:hypothetical protein n=1 Tax=unclassified Serratia (in: enterobacteria) TaxID=2647522 RepID=UPI0030766248
MKSRRLPTVLLAAPMLYAAMIPTADAVSDTATVAVTATFTAPPCTVDIDGTDSKTVSLGVLHLGTQAIAPFNLNITCSYSRTSSVFAEVVTGVVNAATPTAVNMVNDNDPGNTGSPVLLTLSTVDKPAGILYGIDGATDSARQFCSGEDSRICTVTPTTTVNIGTKPGNVAAAIRFTMVNP